MCLRSLHTGISERFFYKVVSLSAPLSYLVTLSPFWIPETLQGCPRGGRGHFQPNKQVPRLRLVTCTRDNLVFNSLVVIFRSQDPPPSFLSGFFGPKDFALA